MRVERPWSSGEDQRSRGDRPLRWYAWFAALSVLCAGLGLTAWERRGSETPSAPRNDAAAEGGSSSTSSRASSPAPTHDPRPDSGGTTGADQPTIPTALADADWYPKYLADQQYAATWLDSFRQVGSEKLRDGISTYTTVIDGARRTWSPPPCGCQRRTVWMYGSATGFGLGQRDDHTIASELAKLAWRDGIALDITNRGVPGDQLGGQINRLAWDLSQGPQPDLVVHLAGWSDLNAANWLNSHGMGNVAQAIDTVALGFFADETVQRTIKQALGAGRARPPRPPGISVEDPSVAVGGPETVAAIAIDRFERALTMGRSLASARGLETFWFWEPMRLARPVAAGEPTRPDDAFNRDVIELTRERLPADVVDISDRLDPSEGPMFFDDSHYNERGAGAAAESIYAALRPALMSSPPAPVQPSGP